MIQMQNNKTIVCTWCTKPAVRVIEETELLQGQVRVTLTQYACLDHMNRPGPAELAKAATASLGMPIEQLPLPVLATAAWYYMRKILPSGMVYEGMRMDDVVEATLRAIRRRSASQRRIEREAQRRVMDNQVTERAIPGRPIPTVAAMTYTDNRKTRREPKVAKRQKK